MNLCQVEARKLQGGWHYCKFLSIHLCLCCKRDVCEKHWDDFYDTLYRVRGRSANTSVSEGENMKRLVLLLLLTISLGVAQTQHSNTLTWNWAQGTSDAATGYRVQRSSTSGGPYTTIVTLVGTAIKTYTDTAVIAGQTNYYVVTAYNGGGDSVPSNQVTCTTPFQTSTAPTSLSSTVN